MSAPKRIQLRRTKGWRKPEGAVVVARPSRWGNPYRVGDLIRDPVNGFNDVPSIAPFNGDVPGVYERTSYDGKSYTQIIRRVDDTSDAVALYRRLIEFEGSDLSPLRGHDLACWCPLDEPCHADVLLELANTSPSPTN